MALSDRRPIIGVMGGSRVSPDVANMAFELGALIAAQGWILLNGGRDLGVMRASAEGAKCNGGLTIGILPGNSKWDANPFIDIPIVTGLSDARNLVNVLSSDIVVALPGSAGTISEIALALKNGRPVILMRMEMDRIFKEYTISGLLHSAQTPEECIALVQQLLVAKN